MTTTRISHTGHNHPSTTAARTACRKALRSASKPTVHGVAVGNGKAWHIAEANVDGTIWGVRCGAGLGRGVKKNSPLTSLGMIELDMVTCKGCRAKYGQAHG